MLEYIARSYPPAWRHIAKLHEESTSPGRIECAKEAIRSYLEVASSEEAGPLWEELAELCRMTGDSIGEVQALVEMADLPHTSLRSLSNAANRFNSLVREQRDAFEMDARQVLARRLLSAMEQRIVQAEAIDYSRMAWLCLMLDDQPAAVEYTRSGLRKDPGNEYCQNLATRLGIRD